MSVTNFLSYHQINEDSLGSDTMIKKVYYIFVFVSMVVLLYFIGETYLALQRAIDERIQTPYPYLMMSLFGFLFGMFIEWGKLFQILRGNIQVRWTLVPSLLLLMLCMVPSYNWLIWYHYGTNFSHNLLFNNVINMMLVMFAGILFVRSISRND